MSELPAKLRKALVGELIAAFDTREFSVLLKIFGIPPDEIAPTDARRTELIVEAIVKAERDATLLDLLEAAVNERKERESLQRTFELIRDYLRDTDFSDLSDSLRRILEENRVGARAIKRIYHAVAPSFVKYELSKTPLDLAFAAITYLATYANRLPLIAFAVLLLKFFRDECSPSCVTALQRWVDDACDRLRLTGDEKRRIVSIVQKGEYSLATARVHLVVSVEPARPELSCTPASEYYISSWIMLVGPDGDVEETEPVAIQELSYGDRLHQDVPAILERAAPRLGARDELTVELFLPIRLLALPADQWKPVRGDDEPEELLGTEYMVVLRSWERAHRWQARHRRFWMSLWSSRKARTSIGMLATAADVNKTFPMRVRLENTSCVALTFVPDDDAIRMVVMSGMPIAVWFRQPVDFTADASKLFTDLLAKHHDDWREDVMRTRWAAAGAKNDFGEHLSVFWDDPERLPPGSIEDPMTV